MEYKTELFIRKFIDDNQLNKFDKYTISQCVINQTMIVIELFYIIEGTTQNITINLLDYITSVTLNYADKGKYNDIFSQRI